MQQSTSRQAVSFADRAKRASVCASLALALSLLVSCASTNEAGNANAAASSQEDLERRCAPAVYPGNALFMGTYGTTVVLAEVATDGRVTNAVVSKSSGITNEHKELDKATLVYIKSCTFLKKPKYAIDFRRVRFHWMLTPAHSGG
jgi:TonB family protein